MRIQLTNVRPSMNSQSVIVPVLLASLFLIFEARAQISDHVVKVGILNDQTSIYADYGGKYSAEAARMAIEDFGGTVLDAPV